MSKHGLSLALFVLRYVFFRGESSQGFTALAPPTSAEQRTVVKTILQRIFGGDNSSSPKEKHDCIDWEERRASARTVSERDGAELHLPQHETVYGELGIDALAKVLDAAGVKEGDSFLDIGSGDGMLVLGASLLYPNHFKACSGVEILPSLYERSIQFQKNFQRILSLDDILASSTNFCLGNIYDVLDKDSSADDRRSSAEQYVSGSTLAVCFATTWSRGEKSRLLYRLSKALGTSMRPTSRAIIIDGRLDAKNDGFIYEGELKIHCPDTAPYSIAHLYTKI